MGKINLVIIFFCFFVALKGQIKEKTIVVITEKDSVELLKNNKNYFFKFYFLDNFKYNKRQKKQVLSGGQTLCETCKKESYSISAILIKKPLNNLRKITVKDFLFKNHGYSDIIYFKSKYYKYNGRMVD